MHRHLVAIANDASRKSETSPKGIVITGETAIEQLNYATQASRGVVRVGQLGVAKMATGYVSVGEGKPIHVYTQTK